MDRNRIAAALDWIAMRTQKNYGVAAPPDLFAGAQMENQDCLRQQDTSAAIHRSPGNVGCRTDAPVDRNQDAATVMAGRRCKGKCYASVTTSRYYDKRQFHAPRNPPLTT